MSSSLQAIDLKNTKSVTELRDQLNKFKVGDLDIIATEENDTPGVYKRNVKGVAELRAQLNEFKVGDPVFMETPEERETPVVKEDSETSVSTDNELVAASQKSKKKICAVCLKDAVKRCESCKSLYYCDSTCQRKHWKKHKHTCILRTAIAAAGGIIPYFAADFPKWLAEQPKLSKKEFVASHQGMKYFFRTLGESPNTGEMMANHFGTQFKLAASKLDWESEGKRESLRSFSFNELLKFAKVLRNGPHHCLAVVIVDARSYMFNGVPSPTNSFDISFTILRAGGTNYLAHSGTGLDILEISNIYQFFQMLHSFMKSKTRKDAEMLYEKIFGIMAGKVSFPKEETIAIDVQKTETKTIFPFLPLFGFTSLGYL